MYAHESASSAMAAVLSHARTTMTWCGQHSAYAMQKCLYRQRAYTGNAPAQATCLKAHSGVHRRSPISAMPSLSLSSFSRTTAPTTPLEGARNEYTCTQRNASRAVTHGVSRSWLRWHRIRQGLAAAHRSVRCGVTPCQAAKWQHGNLAVKRGLQTI